MRGPAGSVLETPAELFGAAQQAGLALELNIVCVQEILRAFARRGPRGQPLPQHLAAAHHAARLRAGARARASCARSGLEPARVVIELTEDYPTVDFRLVHESLMLYRAMGFRVAIDDLGEGFASLRLWSELQARVREGRQALRRAASRRDPVKLQFLRAIQHIAESCGSLVIAEGIENAEDFRVAKDIGIACGQGWFIGRPAADAEHPAAGRGAARLRRHARAGGRRRRGCAPAPSPAPRTSCAPWTPPRRRRTHRARCCERFAAGAALTAIPVIGGERLQGVVSRTRLELVAASPEARAPARARRACEFVDEAPIRVEADLDLAALTALLVESDARRLADGFVIVARGRYLGMGTQRRT